MRGTAPELASLAQLIVLDLNGNELTGEIPPELGGLPNLAVLNLSGNALRGEIPVELGDLANLQVLDLNENRLIGDVPCALFNLASLQNLNLRDNQLTGELPPEMGELVYLDVLDLQDNQLTGEIPAELDNLAFTLRQLRLGGNKLGGCVSDLLRDYAVTSGSGPVCAPANHTGDTETLVALYRAWGQPNLDNWQSREPIGEWEGVSVDATGRVAALDLSRDNLRPNRHRGWLGWMAATQTNEMPPQLGNLTGLRLLNFSGQHHLVGELPEELDNLANLQILNLHGIPRLSLTGGRCLPNAKVFLGSFTVIPPEGLCIGGEEFVSIYNSFYDSCGVTRSGSVACWRAGYFSHLPPWGFTSWALGAEDVCGLRTDGSAACWDRETGYPIISAKGKFTAISSSGNNNNYTCGLRPDGTVDCWGIGRGSGLPTLTGEFASIGAWGYSMCGLRQEGTIECWDRDNKPIVNFSVLNEPGFTLISFDGTGTCGLRRNGTVGCDPHPSSSFLDPFLSGEFTGEFTSLSRGQHYICGVRPDGTVECHGNYTGRHPITSPSGKFVTVNAASAQTCRGQHYICGVRPDGTVECHGNYTGRHPITSPSGKFVTVNAASAQTCGLMLDGTVQCWGTPQFQGQYTSPTGKSFTSINVEGRQSPPCVRRSFGVRTDGSITCCD